MNISWVIYFWNQLRQQLLTIWTSGTQNSDSMIVTFLQLCWQALISEYETWACAFFKTQWQMLPALKNILYVQTISCVLVSFSRSCEWTSTLLKFCSIFLIVLMRKGTSLLKMFELYLYKNCGFPSNSSTVIIIIIIIFSSFISLWKQVI